MCKDNNPVRGAVSDNLGWECPAVPAVGNPVVLPRGCREPINKGADRDNNPEVRKSGQVPHREINPAEHAAADNNRNQAV
jgi:hypothetical protein